MLKAKTIIIKSINPTTREYQRMGHPFPAGSGIKGMAAVATIGKKMIVVSQGNSARFINEAYGNQCKMNLAIGLTIHLSFLTRELIDPENYSRIVREIAHFLILF